MRHISLLLPAHSIKKLPAAQAMQKEEHFCPTCATLGRMLVVDVEASGLDYEKCSILSVGALDLSNPLTQLYEECRAWSGAHVEDGALAVNGFTREQALDPTKQSEADLIHKFKDFAMGLNERTFAGQNVSFDRDFLRVAA